jgi:Uma2 family endonuclease
MSTAEKNLKVSLADYFVYCDSTEGKAEFFDGEIFDMTGGTRNHTRIGTNFIVAVGKRLEGSNCEIAGPDLRIELAAGSKYAYPDASITCGEELFSLDNQQTLRNPLVIIEVLSPSTSDFDRGGKRIYYMAMPSVQAYILIEQSAPEIEVFVRESATDWRSRQISGLDATLELYSLSVPVAIPLAEIYHRVSFAE